MLLLQLLLEASVAVEGVLAKALLVVVVVGWARRRGIVIVRLLAGMGRVAVARSDRRARRTADKAWRPRIVLLSIQGYGLCC